MADHAVAAYWRSRPLYDGGIGFWLSEYLEPLYGRIALADHRTDSVRGLIKYAMAFANGEERQFLPRVIPADAPDDPRARAILPELEAERIEARRAELRTMFASAVRQSADFTAQPDDFLTGILKRTEGQITWQVSVVRNVGWRTFGIIEGPDAFVALVTGLLLNPTHREQIAQCRRCQKFFMIERTEGTPRKLYCGDDCMVAVNAAGSAARARDRYKRNQAIRLLVEQRRDPDRSREAVKQAFKNHPDATTEQLADLAKALLQSARRRK